MPAWPRAWPSPWARPGVADPRPRLYVAGDLGLDVVVRPSAALAWGDDTPARVDLLGGGQGANVAAWARWARPGVEVHLLSQVGADPLGRLLTRAVRAFGVTVHATRAARATRVVSLVEGERRSLLADLPAGPWASLPEAGPAGPALLYVSGYVLVRRGGGAWLRSALAWARRHGVRLAVTPSARSVLARGERGLERWRRLQAAAWAVLMNLDEARALTGAPDARRAATALAATGVVALVTDGRRGAWLAEAGAAARRTPPAAAKRLLDPTGAGDAVAGAFLAALAAGDGPRRAADAAMAAGACAVARQGAWPPPRTSLDRP